MKSINDFVAYYGFTCFSGIGIIDIINGEAVKFAHYYNGEYSRPCIAMVRYNKNGEQFFISHNKRYYLNNFMRIKYR